MLSEQSTLASAGDEVWNERAALVARLTARDTLCIVFTQPVDSRKQSDSRYRYRLHPQTAQRDDDLRGGSGLNAPVLCTHFEQLRPFRWVLGRGCVVVHGRAHVAASRAIRMSGSQERPVGAPRPDASVPNQASLATCVGLWVRRACSEGGGAQPHAGRTPLDSNPSQRKRSPRPHPCGLAHFSAYLRWGRTAVCVSRTRHSLCG
jgi:hypothetical protein